MSYCYFLQIFLVLILSCISSIVCFYFVFNILIFFSYNFSATSKTIFFLLYPLLLLRDFRLPSSKVVLIVFFFYFTISVFHIWAIKKLTRYKTYNDEMKNSWLLTIFPLYDQTRETIPGRCQFYSDLVSKSKPIKLKW